MKRIGLGKVEVAMENLNNPMEKPVIKKRPFNLLGLLIIYLLCTVLLYAFGPIDWKTHNSFQTYGLIFIYIIALALGGWSVKNKFSKQQKHQTEKLDWFYRNYTWIAVFCIIMRILSIERILIRYGYMRILIVNTQSINHDNATGITCRSIFSFLPASDLFELYMQPCQQASDSLKIKSKRLKGRVCLPRTLGNNQNVKSFKQKLRSRLILTLDFEPIILTKKLKKEIEEFKPECIYTLGNAIDVMKLAYKISVYFNIPIIPHFMDNWSESHRYGREKYPTHLKSTQKWLKKIYSRSKSALAISEGMAKVYEEKWGIPHYALMNGVSVKDFYCEKESGKQIQTLVYAGGLHLNRFKSLSDIARTIDVINLERNVNLTLNIFTDKNSIELYKDIFSKYDCVKFCSSVSHSQIKAVYEKADALIHIETFDEEYRDFIKYSLSTKISEYLATGKPILVYAPEEIFLSQYLKENRAAIVVSKQDDLKEQIGELLDEVKVNAICKNSLQLAESKHDEKYNKELILKIFA